jgi:hypothetical protein
MNPGFSIIHPPNLMVLMKAFAPPEYYLPGKVQD